MFDNQTAYCNLQSVNRFGASLRSCSKSDDIFDAVVLVRRCSPCRPPSLKIIQEVFSILANDSSSRTKVTGGDSFESSSVFCHRSFEPIPSKSPPIYSTPSLAKKASKNSAAELIEKTVDKAKAHSWAYLIDTQTIKAAQFITTCYSTTFQRSLMLI